MNAFPHEIWNVLIMVCAAGLASLISNPYFENQELQNAATKKFMKEVTQTSYGILLLWIGFSSMMIMFSPNYMPNVDVSLTIMTTVAFLIHPSVLLYKKRNRKEVEIPKGN
ncbi:hypothetical protein Q7A53_20685 [Halobacillus rhizosphaerae]|uniref:hypothetical protein n=1 Tax=Halobacillus rhizosphaerae TaxID=3064889 RepID=UPI00398A9085